MSSAFTAKLEAAQAQSSPYALLIAPKVEALPPEIARYDDPFLPYARAIFAATHDLVCAYVFDFAAYLTLGAAGAIALERSVNLMRGSHITVLDGHFATDAYANIWDEGAFNADAVTLTADASFTAYQKRDDRQAFVVSNAADHAALYSPTEARFSANAADFRLLPPDTLYQARSLDFETRLRELVTAYVKR